MQNILKDEFKRLNRMNDYFEKKINQGQANGNEPEGIVNNINAMCEIADTFGKLYVNGVI